MQACLKLDTPDLWMLLCICGASDIRTRPYLSHCKATLLSSPTCHFLPPENSPGGPWLLSPAQVWLLWISDQPPLFHNFLSFPWSNHSCNTVAVYALIFITLDSAHFSLGKFSHIRPIGFKSLGFESGLFKSGSLTYLPAVWLRANYFAFYISVFPYINPR